MTAAILYDGYHLTASAGTGIATYAKQLVVAARRSGYRASALFGIEGVPARNMPLLAEIGIFDARPETPPRRLTRIARFLRTWPGAPFGISPVRSPVQEQVLGSSALSGLDYAYVARRTLERAKAHFQRTGRTAQVKIGDPPDLFHLTHPLPLRVRKTPSVVTIHDLIPLRMPSASLDDKRYYYEMVKRVADEAAHIITVSEHSRRDIVQLLGVPESKVTNTWQPIGLPDQAMHIPPDAIRRDLKNGFRLDQGGYFLFFGALEPKKNVGRLVEAYALSGSRRPLVIAGGLGWQYTDDLKRIEDERFLRFARDDDGSFGIARKVRRLPYVPADTLVSLIKGARAVLFPSLYEGFGLPVLEAMAMGTPVMTSSTTSLPEVAGDAALLVDPGDVREMSHAIESLDKDDALTAELSRKGLVRAAFFNRDDYQARVDAVYRRVLGR